LQRFFYKMIISSKYSKKANKRLNCGINFSKMKIMVKKNILFRIFVAFILAFVSISEASAKHIVGGDVTYQCLEVSNGNARFLVTFTMYRDSKGGGAQFDNPARFGLFKGSGTNWSFIRTYSENPSNIENISLDTGNPCLEVPTNIGVQSGVYQFEIVLPISETDSYMIAYQRCCRNNTIFNILSPEDTGAVFSVTISPLAQKECDNSPTFDDFPPVVICANQLLNFDHSATDIDGDEIVYSFCNPISAGGTDGVNFGDKDACTGITPDPAFCGPPFNNVLFKGPQFTFDRPMGLGIDISQITGLISGIPQQTEQFVVGVCATTFRNGVEIGKISRDFQFNVTMCEVAVDASIGADEVQGGNEYIINSCGENTVDFVNLSTDESKIFSYRWELDVNGELVEFDTRDITYTFPDTGQYTGVLLLNNDGVFDNCKDTANVLVNIFPEIKADFTFDYDTCVAGSVDFFNNSVSGAGPILEQKWTFEPGEISMKKDTFFTYETPGVKPVQIVVEDKNECRDSIIKDVTWYPVPPLIVIDPNNFVGCVPGTIRFNNLSSPIDETYDVIWNFGDGGTVNEISPSYIYEEAGVYSVDVTITSPIGCEISKSFTDWISILESPVAGFSYTPDNPSNFNKTVSFTDESEGAVSWFWNMDGLGLLEQNPTYTFQDTGVVEVIQVVTHPTGCTDTMAILLDIEPLVTLHMPNAFTPNNDGLNDTFKGKGFFDGFKNYKMSIWNRWGENIYTTEVPDDGWNGKKDNIGEESPVGVYVYSIEYTGPRGAQKELKGHVTLIR